MLLARTNQDIKNSSEAVEAGGIDAISLRQEFLRLGVELHHRGPRPVAEFVLELADLAPDIATEIQARLEAYTRIPASVYQALGGDAFAPFMISIDGGRK